MNAATIRPHNVASATAWNSGGHDYERISGTIADAIEHCVRCLDLRPGERGARVAGIDLGPDLIEAAQASAAAAGFHPDRRERFKRDFIGYNEGFMTALGVAMPREYLLTLGLRK